MRPAWTVPREVRYAGLPFAVCDLTAATGELLAMSLCRDGPGADVHVCDSSTIARAGHDRDLRALLRGAALNLPSGPVAAWLRQGHDGSGRLPRHGIRAGALFRETLARTATLGIGHFLLGVPPALAPRLRQLARAEFPLARIAGIEPPPGVLAAAGLERQAHRIEASGAAIVWIGLPTPQQHWHAAWLAERLPVVAVAAADAFTAASAAASP